MTQRITIMLDDNTVKALRLIQAQEQKTAIHSVSFSKVINDTLKKGLKK
jgi:hypothetical protein